MSDSQTPVDHQGFVNVACLGAILAASAVLCATVARNGVHWDQETALFPWLIHNGWVLYRDLRDQHSPLFPGLLSLLPDPGSAGTQLVVTVVLVGVVTLSVAVVAWRIAGPIAALLSVLLYSLWLVPFEGEHLWYDLALAPFYLAAILIGLRFWRSQASDRQTVTLGLVIGCAMLVKQPALLVLIGGLPLIAVDAAGHRLRTVLLYLVAGVLPTLVAMLLFYASGSLGDYIYWASTYNLTSPYTLEGASPVPATEWPSLLAVFAVVPAAVLSMFQLRTKWPSSWPQLLFVGSVLLAATFSIWPRYARFHLAAALPLLAVLGGMAVWNLASRRPNWRGVGVVPWAGAALLVLFLLRVTGPQGVRSLRDIWQSPAAPLPYSTTAGPLREWIQANTPSDQPILVYDLDSTLYRVVDRLPPRPWSPLYPWILEGDSTADQWLAGIEAAKPAIALVTPEFVAGRHLPLPDGGRSEAFLRANYTAGPHFTVQKYQNSPTQEIVALQLLGPR
ncbi:MAG TPA: glycosyltransferase family 39 protein [Chloroflexia bacterium]|nr:glycosyltransferase family 39 protein [Chloroflexia bacterium]